MASNMTLPASICVYPLSPTYLPTHRFLYYTSIILSVLYPTPPPLVKGAFAFSLTYSSTAALYALLITAIPPYAVTFNLDIFGLWAILSSACILILPLLHWTKNLHSSNGGSRAAKPIIRIWGSVVIVGAICAYSEMVKWKSMSLAGRGDLTSALQSEDCRSALYQPKLLLRNPEEALVAEHDRIFGSLYALATRISPLVFIPIFFGGMSCLITIRAKSPAQPTSEWGETFVQERPEFTFFSMLHSGFVHLRKLVLAFTPAFLITVVVINEYYLLNGQPLAIPEGEKVYEIGQWGILAGLGLVSAAAAVNWFIGRQTVKTTTNAIIA